MIGMGAIKLYRCADSSGSVLPSGAADAIGRPPNGTPQGNFVIAARTKAEAVEIAARTLGRYTARQLQLGVGGDIDLLVEGGFIPADDRSGWVLAWSSGGRRDTRIVRWHPASEGREDFDVVGVWRYSEDDRHVLPHHLGQHGTDADVLATALSVVHDWRGRGHLAHPELSAALDVVMSAARSTLRDGKKS